MFATVAWNIFRSVDLPSGRSDAGGHWVPAEVSTTSLGGPALGDPWARVLVIGRDASPYIKICGARAFRDKTLAK